MRAALLVPVLLITFGSFAQSTPNPDCAHAIAVPVSPTNVQVAWAMQNLGAIDVGPLDPAPACGPTNGREGWFSFVATGSSHWVRNDGDGSSFALEVFSGTCGNLSSIFCGSNSGPVPLTGLSVGTTYYFRVTSGPTGVLGVAVISAPANDDCANARELFLKPGTAPVMPATETSTATATQSQPGCTVAAAANDDVWYRFTATGNNHWLHTTELLGTQNMINQWFSGTCGNLTSIGCNIISATNLTPGQVYYIRQYSQSTDPDVSIRAFVDAYTAAPNDECASASPVQVAQGQETLVPFAFSNLTSTASTVPCYATTKDVWASFVAPITSVIALFEQIQTVALYSGSCGSLVCEMSDGATSIAFVDLVAGNTYFIKLGGNSSTTNNLMRLITPALNDECTTATALDVLPGSEPTAWTLGATFGATQSLPGCGNQFEADDDTWYSFTAQDTAQLLHLRSLYQIQTLRVELLSGACATPTSLLCVQFNGSNNAVRLSQLTVGTQYLLRICTTSNNARTVIRLAITGLLVNDACAGAVLLTSNTLADFDGMMTTSYNSNMVTNGSGSCAALRDVWFRFIASGSSATFLVPPILDWEVEAFSGSCGALTTLGCFTDVNLHRLSDLINGQEYFLRFAAPQNSPFRPLLFLAPPNDELTGATVLDPNAAAFAANEHEAWTYGATRSLSRLCSEQGVPDDDVWFTFVATQAAHTIRVKDQNQHYATTPLSFGLLIEAYDPFTLDSAGLAQSVIGCGNGTVALSGLTVGNTIYFRVYSYLSGAAHVTAFQVSVSGTNNDEATGAMPIAYGTTYTVLYDTDGATQSQPGADCAVDDFADDDIWFSFTANGSPARIMSSHHDADLTLELFSGTPGNLTSIACSDNILLLPDNLTSGQPIYVRLYSWKNATPVAGRLGLFTTPSITANSCVDEDCLGPVLLPNPGIEQGGACWPMFPGISGGDGITGTPVAPGWFDYHYNTADALNSCADHDTREEVPNRSSSLEFYSTPSRNGKGMGGFFAVFGSSDYKEFQTAPLSAPLVPGQPYLISFYLNTKVFSPLQVNGFGALLTTGITFQPERAAPQVLDLRIIDGGEWQNICGIVIPDQAYDHITIGNFLEYQELLFNGSNSATSYYFLDDVVVALVTDPGCITGLGDVPAMDESTTGEGDNLRVYPNPTNDRVSIVCDAGLFGKRGVIEVFDATGKRVHAEQVAALGALQQLDLSSEWREGLYLVMVRVEGQAPRSARVVVRR